MAILGDEQWPQMAKTVRNVKGFCNMLEKERNECPCVGVCVSWSRNGAVLALQGCVVNDQETMASNE